MTARARHGGAIGALLALALLAGGCGAADSPEAQREQQAAQRGEQAPPMNPIARLLAAGEATFGIFSGEHTPEQGARVAENREADFVFYSLESGPFDIPGFEAYGAAMREAAERTGVDPHPLVLRVPPIEDGQATRERVGAALDAGVAGIVFPHVATAEQAQLSVEALAGGSPAGGAAAAGASADGDAGAVNIVIVEDREGIANVRDIVATPGLNVVFAGPGDLRRAYDGDMEAVETAIQTVLAACKEFEVSCGVTAGADDIAQRLEEGFSVIIVTEPEALSVGRRAAGRAD